MAGEENRRLFFCLHKVGESAGGPPHIQAEQSGNLLDNLHPEGRRFFHEEIETFVGQGYEGRRLFGKDRCRPGRFVYQGHLSDRTALGQSGDNDGASIFRGLKDFEQSPEHKTHKVAFVSLDKEKLALVELDIAHVPGEDRQFIFIKTIENRQVGEECSGVFLSFRERVLCHIGVCFENAADLFVPQYLDFSRYCRMKGELPFRKMATRASNGMLSASLR